MRVSLPDLRGISAGFRPVQHLLLAGPYRLQSTVTTNGRWTRTTMDGFGRTVKTEVGTGGTTVSVVDAVYDACGCSPLGKLKQTSMPHAPGAGELGAGFSYDGFGNLTGKAVLVGSVPTARPKSIP